MLKKPPESTDSGGFLNAECKLQFVKLFINVKLVINRRGRCPRRPFVKCNINFTVSCRGGALSPPVTRPIYQCREGVESLPYNIIFTLIFPQTFRDVEDAVPYIFDIQFNAYDTPTNRNLSIYYKY